MGIMDFYIYKVPTQIIYDILMELLILLNQNHTNHLHGRGLINKKVMAIVGWTKHGGRCQGFLQCIEGLLGSLIPYEQSILLQNAHKTLGQIGKVDDKYP